MKQINLLIYCLNVLKFDPNGDGHISSSEIGTVMKSLGEDIPGYKLRDIVQQLDKNKNGTIEFKEFLEVGR